MEMLSVQAAYKLGLLIALVFVAGFALVYFLIAGFRAAQLSHIARSASRAVDKIAAQLAEFDRRIFSLRIASNVFLVLVVGSLIVSLNLILDAGKLTRLETQSSDIELRIDRNLHNLQSSRQEDLRRINTGEEFMRVRSELLPELLHAAEPTSPENEDKIRREITSAWIEGVKSREALILADYKDNIDRLEKLSADVLEKEANDAVTDRTTDTNFMAATTLTRVSILVILIFLVQILLGMYRYNMKLVTFYSSRRDAVLLSDGGAAGLGELAKFVTPAIDFGKEPKHPVQEMMASLVGKRSSGRTRQRAAGDEPKV